MQPNLPPEIRGEIMKWDTGLLKTSQIVNKGTARATAPYYLEQLCNNPISLTEFQTYLATDPIAVGEFDIDTLSRPDPPFSSRYQVMDCFFTMSMPDRGYDRSLYQAYLFVSDIAAGFGQDSLTASQYYNKIVPHGRSSYAGRVDLLDLLTSYNIYKQRQRCQTLYLQQPMVTATSWAGHKVRTDFEQIINTGYQTWSSFPLLNELKLHLYLYINCSVLDANEVIPGNSYPEFFELAFDVDRSQLQFDQQDRVVPTSVHLLPMTPEKQQQLDQIRADNEVMIKLLQQVIAKW